MNKVANRQVICEVLCEKAQMDQDIVVLCSDSRGSASLAPFAKAFPGQFVEAGIAEQDLVGIAAGLARSGKKAFAASPGLLFVHEKPGTGEGGCGLLEYQCKINRNQRRGQLRSPGYESSFCTGYSRHGFHSQYACISAQ